MVSEGLGSGDISYFVPVVKALDFIGQINSISSPSIPSFKVVFKAELDSTELPFQLRTHVLEFIELRDGDIPPMRDLDDPLNLFKEYLGFVIDTMDDMLLSSEGTAIGSLESHTGEAFLLAIGIERPKIMAEITVSWRIDRKWRTPSPCREIGNIYCPRTRTSDPRPCQCSWGN